MGATGSSVLGSSTVERSVDGERSRLGSGEEGGESSESSEESQSLRVVVRGGLIGVLVVSTSFWESLVGEKSTSDGRNLFDGCLKWRRVIPFVLKASL